MGPEITDMRDTRFQSKHPAAYGQGRLLAFRPFSFRRVMCEDKTPFSRQSMRRVGSWDVTSSGMDRGPRRSARSRSSVNSGYDPILGSKASVNSRYDPIMRRVGSGDVTPSGIDRGSEVSGKKHG